MAPPGRGPAWARGRAGGLPHPRSSSQRVPLPERRDERTIVPGWAAVRAGHGHPTSPLCPAALPLSFLPPTETLGIVWGGENPPHNPVIIFWGKVLADFPLNPVSMRQPKPPCGNKPGPGNGGAECPRPGKSPASSGSRRRHRTEVPGAPGGMQGSSGGGRRGHSTFPSRPFSSRGGRVSSHVYLRVPGLGWGGTGDTGSCWGGGSMDCSPAQLQ